MLTIVDNKAVDIDKAVELSWICWRIYCLTDNGNSADLRFAVAVKTNCTNLRSAVVLAVKNNIITYLLFAAIVAVKSNSADFPYIISRRKICSTDPPP